MSFFNNLGKKITSATQDVARGAKELADTARLSGMVSDEQKKISGLFTEIGKWFYENQSADPNTPGGRLCAEVSAANERINALQNEILLIKGMVRCSACGVEVPANLQFCGSCGAKVEHPTPPATPAPPEFGAAAPPPIPAPAPALNTCRNCGAPLNQGAAFCTSCGQKNE